MAEAPAPPRGFFRRRWNGAVSPERLLLVDMLLVGTLINVALAFLALVVLGLKCPLWAAMTVYFLAMPYNLFLTIAMWRATATLSAARAGAWRLAAVGWLAIATLI